MAASEAKVAKNRISVASPLTQGRQRIARFFQDKRLVSGISLEHAAGTMGLRSTQELLAYESGQIAIPLEEIFALTNLLNIAPEDVLGLIYDVSSDLKSTKECM